MINSYNTSSQTIDVNGLVEFNGTNISTGCTVTQSGTTAFKLNKSGFYFVSFNANVATSATAGDVTVQLNNNGTAVKGATATFNSSATTAIGTIAFSTIIQIRPSCCAINNQGNLTLENTGISAIYSNANITITKLC